MGMRLGGMRTLQSPGRSHSSQQPIHMARRAAQPLDPCCARCVLRVVLSGPCPAHACTMCCGPAALQTVRGRLWHLPLVLPGSCMLMPPLHAPLPQEVDLVDELRLRGLSRSAACAFLDEGRPTLELTVREGSEIKGWFKRGAPHPGALSKGGIRD